MNQINQLISHLIKDYNLKYAEVSSHFKPISDIAYEPITPLAEAIGRPKDEAILLICLTLNVIISLLISHIKTPLLRKILNTGLGLAMTTYCYGLEIFLFIAYNMIGYTFMKFGPRKYSHYISILLSGSLLTVGNIYEMVEGTIGYNISTLCMITFVK